MHKTALMFAAAAVALAIVVFLNLDRKPDQAAVALTGSDLPSSSTTRTRVSNVGNPGAVVETAAPPASLLQPVEQPLFANDSLNVHRAESIVNDPAQFESVLRKLRDQYYTDPDATALVATYRAQIAGTLAASTAGLELADMACGLSVCAAEFTSASRLAPMEFLEPVMNSGNDGGAKLYSAVMGVGKPSDADPRPTYRLVFATDPSARELRASPKR